DLRMIRIESARSALRFSLLGKTTRESFREGGRFEEEFEWDGVRFDRLSNRFQLSGRRHVQSSRVKDFVAFVVLGIHHEEDARIMVEARLRGTLCRVGEITAKGRPVTLGRVTRALDPSESSLRKMISVREWGQLRFQMSCDGVEWIENGFFVLRAVPVEPIG